ncbi:hypothetical protein [Hymenobacter sp. BT491]|uniref:hypothetical protein n=1 Tax=Hymenobacter sp. BT491 TaxID=2766779 RepID=UPI0016539D27|nr:hypothetical protein [Hymenobacter sp. BT491]MBC6992285.1 hypothetical protein [Hymenobacter sp. BT491]
MSFTAKCILLRLLKLRTVMSYSIANRRYRQIQTRSFERLLDLFLTAHYLRNPDPSLPTATVESFRVFVPTDKERSAYLKSWQSPTLTNLVEGSAIREIDDAIKNWRKLHAAELLPAFKAHANKSYCIGEEAFQALYGQDSEKRACFYCGINEADVTRLIENRLLYTKRLGTRGRRMEVDCKVPQLGYVPDNVALCCYWCNNAKSDEFTEAEFMPVAQGFKQVWKQRLSECKV